MDVERDLTQRAVSGPPCISYLQREPHGDDELVVGADLHALRQGERDVGRVEVVERPGHAGPAAAGSVLLLDTDALVVVPGAP
ncbi:hypothetical protein CFP66_06740 [Pseudonocardia sp. MH-G8]|nr:hypothetical protein CFP66_06740 [Pseudonocardia sp. MH-G8]